MNKKSKMQMVAIIPARYGSKRIRKKNIRPLAGKPLVFWTIDAALGAGCLDELVLSTDSVEIANLCQSNYPSLSIHVRPEHLATDTASTVDVVIDVIEALVAEGRDYEYAMVLQPTSPLRSISDIRISSELIKTKKSNSLISICETDHPIEWTTKLPLDGNLAPFVSSLKLLPRSQDIEKSYRVNGAIYISLIEKILESKSLFDDEITCLYIMDKARSIDIDEEIDFSIAEALIQNFP